MRLVAAPDKFKGTLSAEQAARAMAEGARRVAPDIEVDIAPVADGGDGTVNALMAASRFARGESSFVSGPFGESVTAPIAVLGRELACVEMATASGLALVAGRPDALAASSKGTGELIVAARDHAQTVAVGIGGSASTDGGAGAAMAAGWRFLDSRGKPLPPGGGALVRLHTIEPPPQPLSASVLGLCDVTNPLLGPHGAALVFGPQKGASESEVAALEAGLTTLAMRIHERLGIDVTKVPRGGAGGGMGAGLVAFFGAELHDGFEFMVRHVGLADRISHADIVLTGEGRLDEQTLAGKAPLGVARLAAAAGVPCIALAGKIDVEMEQLRAAGISYAASLEDELGSNGATRDAYNGLAVLTEAVLRRFVDA